MTRTRNHFFPLAIILLTITQGLECVTFANFQPVGTSSNWKVWLSDIPSTVSQAVTWTAACPQCQTFLHKSYVVAYLETNSTTFDRTAIHISAGSNVQFASNNNTVDYTSTHPPIHVFSSDLLAARAALLDSVRQHMLSMLARNVTDRFFHWLG